MLVLGDSRVFFGYVLVFAAAYADLVVERNGQDEVLNASPMGCDNIVGRPTEGSAVKCKCGMMDNTVAAMPGQEAKCLKMSALGCSSVFSVQMTSGSLHIPSIHGCNKLQDVFLWNLDKNTNKAVWTNINSKATNFLNGQSVNVAKWKGHLLKLVSSCDPSKCAVLKVGGGMVTYPFDLNQLDLQPTGDDKGNAKIKVSLGGGLGSSSISSSIGGGFGGGFGGSFGDMFAGWDNWFSNFNKRFRLKK